MTAPVPLEAAGRIRALQALGASFPLSADIDALIEFAKRFETVGLPGMTQELAVAGEMREILLTDEGLDAQSFDLIRLNGRVYAPEVIEVEDDDFDPALFPALPSVGEISNALRWLAPLQADDARKTLLEIAAGRLDASVDFPEPRELPHPVTRELIDALGRGEADAQGKAMDILAALAGLPIAPTVLHVAGNGHALTTATIETVIEDLERVSENRVEGDVGAAIDDAVRLIRFLVEVVLAEMGRAPVSRDNPAHKLAASRMRQAFGIGREAAEEALRSNAPARAIFDAAVAVIAELIEGKDPFDDIFRLSEEERLRMFDLDPDILRKAANR